MYIVVWIIWGILVKFDDPNIVLWVVMMELKDCIDGIAMNVVIESL